VKAKGPKPRIFIGSSAERLDVAHTIRQLLEFDADATVWTQGLFEPSRQDVVDLLAAARSHRLAVFAFTGDDLARLRLERMRAARDAVMFELGLFIGAVGPDRCFMVVPRDADALSTDLTGMTLLACGLGQSERDPLAALAPVCGRIRRAIAAGPPGPAERAQHYVEAWNASDLMEVRRALRELALDPFDPEFEELRPALRRLFAFLESMSDAVLSGRIDEHAARMAFEKPVQTLWPRLRALLAPPIEANGWWDPPPDLARLDARWTTNPT